MKLCKVCGEEKPLSAFERHNHGGYMGTCRRCRQLQQNQRRKAARDLRRGLSRKSIMYVESCQACGAPVDGSALCDECDALIPNTSGKDGSLCSACPFLAPCKRRVDMFYWAICEIPDVADRERVKAIYG